MRTMPRTKFGGIFGTGSAKTQHVRRPGGPGCATRGVKVIDELFDRDCEAADQCGDFVEPRRIVRLDGAREAGQAFIIAELGNVRRQNRGGHFGTVEDVWHWNHLRKDPAPAKLDLNWVELASPS
ncbi:hypothetical protein ACVWZ3_003727 [Bradyrhizobium sp. i1.3.6]